MAKEIWITGATGQEVNVLFLADIVTAGGTVAVDKDGANVVYVPSTGVPAGLAVVMAADVSPGGGAEWLAALDAGTALFWTSSYVPVPGETGPQALARVRVMYAAQAAAEIVRYTTYNKYIARVFQVFDAV